MYMKKIKSLRYVICNIFCEFFKDFLYIVSELVIYNFLRNLLNKKKIFLFLKFVWNFKKWICFMFLNIGICSYLYIYVNILNCFNLN